MIKPKIKLSTKVLKQSEAEILKQCLQWLEVSGWLAWRMPLGGIMHSIGSKIVYKKNHLSGFPDICGVLKDKPLPIFWACELKTTKGRLSDNQKYWHKKLEKGGVEVFIARSLSEMIWGLKQLTTKYSTFFVNKYFNDLEIKNVKAELLEETLWEK